MRLFLLLLAILVGISYERIFTHTTNGGQSIRRLELAQLAREVEAKDAALVYERKLNQRIQKEQGNFLASIPGRIDGGSGPHGFDLVKYIYQLFGEDATVAIAIFRAESNFNCNAKSRTGDFGIGQINQVHLWRFRGVSPFECFKNIEVAYQIYLESGFSPWSAFKNKSYLRYL